MKSGSPSRTTAAHETQTKIQDWSSLSSTVVTPHLTETGEWCRCRSLPITPPASLRSHSSRPRPTRHIIYGVSSMVGLFGSSQSTETDVLERRRVQNSSNLHIRKFKWYGCIKKNVFISVLHLSTLSGRFRVGFGVGHISNTIELSFLATVPGYLNSEPPQYVPEAT